jgi:membrane-associated phospholipid phosphatase
MVVAITPRSSYRILTRVLTAMAVAAVGFSRIELGVHWNTDVIASIFFVSAWLVVLFAFFASDIPEAHRRPGSLMRTPRFRRSGAMVSAYPQTPALCAVRP